MAPHYKLMYFNMMGLAEPVRYMLSYGGVDFEDVRIDRADWPKIKPTMPFGKVPVLEVDGKMIHQSTAICRYLATQFNLYGRDNSERLEINMTMDTITDLRQQLMVFHYETDEAVKARKKETALKETLPTYLPRFQDQINRNGGYFVGGRLSMVDLCWVSLHDYMNGMLGHDLTRDYPGLKAHRDKINELPAIAAWIKRRPKTDF